MSTKEMKTKEHWFKCCGSEQLIGGTYIARYGYDFTVYPCGHRHRSLWNMIMDLFGLIPKMRYLDE